MNDGLRKPVFHSSFIIPHSSFPHRPAFGRFGFGRSSAGRGVASDSSASVPTFKSARPRWACGPVERLCSLFGAPGSGRYFLPSPVGGSFFLSPLPFNSPPPLANSEKF